MVLPVLPDLTSKGDDVKFLGIFKNNGDDPSGAGRSSKTFPDVPIEFRVLSGNPESRQSMSGARNSRGLNGNVGHSRAASCLRIVKFSPHSRHSPCLAVLNLRQELIHCRGFIFLLRMKFICPQMPSSAKLCPLLQDIRNSSITKQSFA